MNSELIGKTIKLMPLGDEHYESLQSIVLTYHDVYRYTTMGQTVADFARWFVLGKESNAWAVIRLSDNQVVGSTRLYHLNSAVGSVNVGYTWYHPDCRGIGINDEAKLLLLGYVFDELQLNRVVFEINAENIASRKAVEKLDAVLEGILRQSRRDSAGKLADTCVYSILAEQWTSVKQQLQKKVGAR